MTHPHQIDDGYKRRVQLAGHEVLAALLRVQIDGEDQGFIDPDFSIDVLMSVSAALIETIPEYRTAQQLRHASEAAGLQLKLMAKEYRALFERTGKRGAEVFGGLIRETANDVS